MESLGVITMRTLVNETAETIATISESEAQS